MSLSALLPPSWTLAVVWGVQLEPTLARELDSGGVGWW